MALAALVALVLSTGCPHRSPVWSPDGSHLLVLTGARGEKVESPATQLWLLDLAGGSRRRLPAPEEGARFLAATWERNDRFIVATGRWDGEYVTEGTEKLWRRSVPGEAWERIEAPAPSGARATRRLPVAFRRRTKPAEGGEGETVLVYPSGGEKVVAVSLATGRTLLEIEPADVVGPGPGGGFLAYRENSSGVIELVAFGSDLKELWTKKFSQLRSGIARRLGKKPVEIVFNELSTSHLPLGGAEPEWVGVTLIYAAPGWEDGIPGFYVRLAADDGAVMDAARAKGLWGQPASVGGLAWCVTAPEPKRKTPSRLRAFRLETGEPAGGASLESHRKEAIYGYSIDAAGRRLALSVHAAAPEVFIYPLEDPGELAPPKKIALE